MATHAWAGFENVHARVQIRQFDRFMNADPRIFRNTGEDVSKGNVNITVRVLHQLGKLGDAILREHDFALAEALVNCQGMVGTGRRQAADDAVIIDQLAYGVAR